MKPANPEPFQRRGAGLKVAQPGSILGADDRDAEKVFRQGKLPIAVDDAFLFQRLANHLQLAHHQPPRVVRVNVDNFQLQAETVMHFHPRLYQDLQVRCQILTALLAEAHQQRKRTSNGRAFHITALTLAT